MVRFVTALVGLLAVSTDAALRGNNASGEEASATANDASTHRELQQCPAGSEFSSSPNGGADNSERLLLREGVIDELPRSLCGNKGGKNVILVVGDGMGWEMVRAGAIARKVVNELEELGCDIAAGCVGDTAAMARFEGRTLADYYTEGKGDGLSFQELEGYGLVTTTSTVNQKPNAGNHYAPSNSLLEGDVSSHDDGMAPLALDECGNPIDFSPLDYEEDGGNMVLWSDIKGGEFPWDPRYFQENPDTSDGFDPTYIMQHATDSASTAGTLATGHKAAVNMVSVNMYEETVSTIVEDAMMCGKAGGVVSSVPMLHATPGAFVVHSNNRSNRDQLRRSFMEVNPTFSSGVCGGRYYPTEEALESMRTGALSSQWTFLEQMEGISADDFYTSAQDLDPDNGDHLLVCLGGDFTASGQSNLPYRGVDSTYSNRFCSSGDAVLDPDTGLPISVTPTTETCNHYEQEEIAQIPHISTNVLEALDFLGKDDDGFFLMYEQGDIDWAAHANHMDDMIGTMFDIDDSVAGIIKWIQANGGYEKNALYVTADHDHYLTLLDNFPEALANFIIAGESHKITPENNSGVNPMSAAVKAGRHNDANKTQIEHIADFTTWTQADIDTVGHFWGARGSGGNGWGSHSTRPVPLSYAGDDGCIEQLTGAGYQVLGRKVGGIPGKIDQTHLHACMMKSLFGLATKEMPAFPDGVCANTELEYNSGTTGLLSTIFNAEAITAGLQQYKNDGVYIGSTTALIPEASDAAATGATIRDGQSGDVDFAFGNLKALATVGERSVCDASLGKKIVGVPDGLGAYLIDDETVRVVVQSESYGPLRYESYPIPVNEGAATFSGSHVQFVDYTRESMATFMQSDVPASMMVTGMGEVIENVVNLKGEPVGPRNRDGPTMTGAHYGNTDADGSYAVAAPPSEADWFFQSLCSAHLEQKYQWGAGIGLEDNLFMTNEEWMDYADGSQFVGIGAHAVDLMENTAHAIGAFSLGGFEKNVEMNPQNADYVTFAMSGYNGNFAGNSAVLQARKDEYGVGANLTRPDGMDYIWTENVVPFRFYVGAKGFLEDGSVAPADDFLARNGLKYGKVYGFAIDMSETGPSTGLWRDDFHRDVVLAKNGANVTGKWIAQDWQWDGVVTNFQNDGSWDFQLPPPGTGIAGTELENFAWWNSAGYDESGCKTEHVSPDPRAGRTAFIQGSTCGYFGHAYVNGVAEALAAAAPGTLPATFDGEWLVYQGESDITAQIELGGKGQHADGRDALRNWDNAAGEGKVTFEDIDGLELFESDDGSLYAMIQEDSGNDYGERLFITGPLEHVNDENDLTYYLVALSGGVKNTRMVAGVGIPAGTNCDPGSHEFSGLFDLSGLLRMENGTFAMSAADEGSVKRAQDALVNINDKQILVGLQAGNMHCGIIEAFQADRGGQWLMYQPELPVS